MKDPKSNMNKVFENVSVIAHIVNVMLIYQYHLYSQL